jgi:hypothetical protein
MPALATATNASGTSQRLVESGRGEIVVMVWLAQRDRLKPGRYETGIYRYGVTRKVGT